MIISIHYAFSNDMIQIFKSHPRLIERADSSERKQEETDSKIGNNERHKEKYIKYVECRSVDITSSST